MVKRFGSFFYLITQILLHSFEHVAETKTSSSKVSTISIRMLKLSFSIEM
jgi:hypothetical protein